MHMTPPRSPQRCRSASHADRQRIASTSYTELCVDHTRLARLASVAKRAVVDEDDAGQHQQVIDTWRVEAV